MLHHKPLIPWLNSLLLQKAGKRLANMLTAYSQGWEAAERRRRRENSGKIKGESQQRDGGRPETTALHEETDLERDGVKKVRMIKRDLNSHFLKTKSSFQTKKITFEKLQPVSVCYYVLKNDKIMIDCQKTTNNLWTYNYK